MLNKLQSPLITWHFYFSSLYFLSVLLNFQIIWERRNDYLIRHPSINPKAYLKYYLKVTWIRKSVFLSIFTLKGYNFKKSLRHVWLLYLNKNIFHFIATLHNTNLSKRVTIDCILTAMYKKLFLFFFWSCVMFLTNI